MFLARSHIARASARAVGAVARNPTQKFGRRTYAAAHAIKKSSDLPWFVVSAGIGGPAIYYVYQSGVKKDDHHGLHGEEHGADKGGDRGLSM